MKTSEEFLLEVKKFAIEAHVGQFRKYTGSHYIVHPAAVAKRVSKVEGYTVEMIAAAWLHDVVEDTHYSILEVEKLFGIHVATLVDGLTDYLKPSDGNRAFRKEAYQMKLKHCSYEVQTIKLADMYDNIPSIIKYDKNFAKIYLKEKKLMLAVLTKGDFDLYYEVGSIIDNYYRGK